mmetsp:Transcript_17970/g.58665  ORF Transcript_17970/g.58665 Transcript_17970/m.58665 type:complete len:208 (+) Transcript_17970:223-846(+)
MDFPPPADRGAYICRYSFRRRYRRRSCFVHTNVSTTPPRTPSPSSHGNGSASQNISVDAGGSGCNVVCFGGSFVVADTCNVEVVLSKKESGSSDSSLTPVSAFNSATPSAVSISSCVASGSTCAFTNVVTLTEMRTRRPTLSSTSVKCISFTATSAMEMLKTCAVSCRTKLVSTKSLLAATPAIEPASNSARERLPMKLTTKSMRTA